MEDKYDVCVLGTGLTECILSGLLSVSGWKVLHLDRNDYYGGENASLNIDQLYEKFEGKESKPPKEFGKPRDWNVDLIPKFVMANGLLMKLLQSCGITNLDFTLVEGSYVVIKDKIQKVPSNVTEVANSPLMSFWEKNRCRKFLMYVLGYKKEDKNTHGGYNLMKMKMKELYNAYGLVEDTIDFLGHSVALYTNDDYLEQPAEPTVYRLKLYYESLGMYGKSPYVYPLYGLGELPQVFARLCAVYGGVYMLNKPIDKIHYDEEGKFVGVESEKEIAKVPIIVGDPTYFKEKVKKVGSFIRAICILSAPVKDTNDSKSCQIIIPQKQTKRKSDIYISVVSSAHHVCLKGKYLAIIQTEQETNDTKKELSYALDLVGKADKVFINVTDNLVPTSNGKKDNVFISKSVDTTCHFETVVDDVLDLYYRITGKQFDLSISKEERDKEIMKKREKEEKEREEKEKKEKEEKKE